MTELRRTIDLPAPPAVVWDRLWDIAALARCIPGCDGVEQVEEHRRYRATVRDRVGPFRIAIPLDIAVEATPRSRLAVSATGRDATLGSPVKVALTVSVEARGGGTCLEVTGRVDIAGKLASLGQGVIARRTADALDQFAANLAGLFLGPETGGPPAGRPSS